MLTVTKTFWVSGHSSSQEFLDVIGRITSVFRLVNTCCGRAVPKILLMFALPLLVFAMTSRAHIPFEEAKNVPAVGAAFDNYMGQVRAGFEQLRR